MMHFKALRAQALCVCGCVGVCVCNEVVEPRARACVRMRVRACACTLWVAEHGPEGADDVVGLEADRLILVLQPLPVLGLLRAAELQARHAAPLQQHLAGRQEGQELTLLLLRQLHLRMSKHRVGPLLYKWRMDCIHIALFL